MLEKYIEELKNKKEIYLRIKVFPNSSKTKVKEIKIDNIENKNVETLIINIKAQAEKNKANQELMKFLAKEFKILEKYISIISGASSRIKLIKIKI
ncbi:MAG TPA: DUF167 domain-containing protein [bacterium]|nr:DUF167 domain-containing protein [bacterium]HPV65557.1 DUF167 domain-containing protein [bacterium]